MNGFLDHVIRLQTAQFWLLRKIYASNSIAYRLIERTRAKTCFHLTPNVWVSGVKL